MADDDLCQHFSHDARGRTASASGAMDLEADENAVPPNEISVRIAAAPLRGKPAAFFCGAPVHALRNVMEKRAEPKLVTRHCRPVVTAAATPIGPSLARGSYEAHFDAFWPVTALRYRALVRKKARDCPRASWGALSYGLECSARLS